MNCPKCNHEQSRVVDLKRKPDGLRRGRICVSCGHKFSTLERIEVWDSTLHGYVAAGNSPVPLAVLPDLAPIKSKRAASARHEASLQEQCLTYVTADARPLLVQWWNESRHSKHRANATWTKAAWEASVQRVANMPSDLQLALCQAGVEHGWQALKLDYIAVNGPGRLQPAPRADGRPMPKDPAMLAALEQWPKQTT